MTFSTVGLKVKLFVNIQYVTEFESPCIFQVVQTDSKPLKNHESNKISSGFIYLIFVRAS